MLNENGKHRFSTCNQCNQPLYFEDARKRIESGKWVHASCWDNSIHKPFAMPHQKENGMKHTGNGNGSHSNGNGVTITEPPKQETTGQGILERILASEITKITLTESKVRDIINQELAAHIPKIQTIEVIKQDGSRKEIGGVHKQFGKLLKLIAYGKHCYLYGAPGSGKSTSAMQCAEALSLPYYYDSCNPQTPESRLIGYMHANGAYVPTKLRQAYENGGVYFLDELDNASPSLCVTLNNLIENGHGSFPDKMIKRHPQFVLVAAGNTNGNGANIQFPDRRAFDGAFKDRYVFLKWEYDLDLEKSIAFSINPNCIKWLEWIWKVRGYVQDNNIRLVVSPRASFAGALLMKDDTFTMRDIADMVLFKGLDQDTVDNILRSNPLPRAA